MKILKTLRKRGLALFLVLTMCISLLPVQAMAAELDLWPADGLEPICGKEEHSHGAECYTAVSRLTCAVEENHVHGEDCYAAGESALLCMEDHVHGDECYVPGEPVLACAVEENHVHGEDCYTVETSLTCGLEEHEHSEECYVVQEPEVEEIPEIVIPEGATEVEASWMLAQIPAAEKAAMSVWNLFGLVRDTYRNVLNGNFPKALTFVGENVEETVWYEDARESDPAVIRVTGDTITYYGTPVTVYFQGVVKGNDGIGLLASETDSASHGIVFRHYASVNDNVPASARNEIKYEVDFVDADGVAQTKPAGTIIPDTIAFDVDVLPITSNTFHEIVVPGYTFDNAYCYFYWYGNFKGEKRAVDEFKNFGRISNNFSEESNKYDSYIGFHQTVDPGADYGNDGGPYNAYNPTGTLRIVFTKTTVQNPPKTIYYSMGTQVHLVTDSGAEWDANRGLYTYLPVDARDKITVTNPGYRLEGWTRTAGTDGNGTGAIVDSAFFNTRVDSDVRLYAKWVKRVTASFDLNYTNAGNPPASQSGDSPLTVTKPADPTRAGYTFQGWFTAATGGTEVDFTTGAPVITTDTTYYAHWEEDTAGYTVKYYYDSEISTEWTQLGSDVTGTATIGDPIPYVTVPGSVAGLPTGYVFDHATYGSADVEITTSSNVVVTGTAAANVVKVYFAIDKIGGENGGDTVPDRYQTTVTFNVEYGYWGTAGTDNSPKTKVVTLKDSSGKWSENGRYTLTEADLPYGEVGSNPDADHRNGDDSCWSLEVGSTPAGQVVTKTNNSFTYTYPAKRLMTVTATYIDRQYNGETDSIAVTVKDADTRADLTGTVIACYTDAQCTISVRNAFKNVADFTKVYVKVTCPGYLDKIVETSVRITPATLTVTMGSVTKEYDGTTDVSEEKLPAFTVTGIVGNEDVSVVLGDSGSVAYTNKDVGIGNKTVTAVGLALSGADAANYTLASTVVTNTTSTITSKPVTVTLGAATKMYDGNTSVPADQVRISLDGVLDVDKVVDQSLVTATVTGGVTYDSKDAGRNDKTITAKGVVLIGSAVMNYTLVDAEGKPVTTLDVTNDASTITPRSVTLTSAGATKTYDGTPLTKNAETDVTVTGDGFVANEGVASYNFTGSQTYVGSSKNDFSYSLNANTTAGNYIIRQEMGMLKVQGKVIYDANGGTGAPADSDPVDLGAFVTVSTVEPTRDNFTFLGWATSADAAESDVNGSIQMGTENIILYAVWAQDTYTVNVAYKLTDDGKGMTDHTADMPAAQKTAVVNCPNGWRVAVSEIALPDATITAPDRILVDGKTYVQDVLLSDSDDDLAGDAQAKDETVNVTLVYALDVQGGTDADGEETGDSVPDYRQAFVKYVSGDIKKGTVTGDTVKAYTLSKDAESGAYTGDITPGTEGVTVTPKTGYVFAWDTDPTEVLHVDGGRTYVFTAIFDIGKYPVSVEFYFDGQKDEDETVNGEADYESIFTFTPQVTRSYNGSNYALDRIEKNSLTVSTDPEENVVKVYYALDEDQNGNPDIYDATMIYRIDGGTWDGETGSAQTAGRKVVLAVSKWDEVTQKREDLNPTVADRKVPAGTHDEEHTGSGVWSAVSGTEINDPASEALVLAAGETYIFQLTFQPMGATLVDIVNNGELNASSHEWVYDGAYHNVTAVVTGADGVVYNAPEYSTDGGETWSVTPPSVRNVAEGTVRVQVRATSSGYKTLTAAYTMRINPRPVTITVNNASKTAGWIDPAFSGRITSGSLVRNGDLGQITYVRGEAGEEVGTYLLTANYTHNDNYNVTVVRGVLTIYADTALPPPEPTTPGGPIIPEVNPPLGPSPDDGVIIEDAEIPLANAVGLNDTDHFAYIIGYEDDTVRPLNNITRAEAVTIFFRLMSDEYRAANWSTENSFSDVNAGNWYNNAVSTCLKAGVLEHFAQDAAFLPTQAITRAEFASIAAGFVSDEITGEEVGDFSDTEGHWASLYIRKAVQAGWINGVGGNRFAPDETITRAQVMTMINRMLDRIPDAEHMLPTMKVWIDNPEGNWYYGAVQEATNGHEYERDEMGVVETWTGLTDNRDWTALEAEWVANGGSITPVVPAEPAEGEAGSDSEAGNG